MTTTWRTLGIALALAAAGCTSAAPSAQDVAADKAKLLADAGSWYGYYANADADGLANLYAEDALLMPPEVAAITGRAGIKTYLGDDSAKMKAAGLSIKNGPVTGADVSGDMGWVSGHYTVADGSGAVIGGGSYMSIHKRTNGQWLFIRDTWNSDRPPAPAK